MSIIFGVRQNSGQKVDETFLRAQAVQTARYASDGTFLGTFEEIGMGYQPYHTTQRSLLDTQPLMDAGGNCIVFDGRLDNHRDLQARLDIRSISTPDSAIVLSAFCRWGEQCFSRLTGDWALALWSRDKRTLYLARDHAGTRTLYYRDNNGQLTWSTYLESLLFPRGGSATNEEFAARYLAGLPIGPTTPYQGVHAVPPAHYLVCRTDTIERRRYWTPFADEKIDYKTDAEYDEHFLSLFRLAVERRTVRGAPILAQLSGGMDSTSIVCMSDQARRDDAGPTAEVLDTVSFYDDSEPNWDERPYFSVTELYRGKRGIHIDSSTFRWTFDLPDSAEISDRLPGFTRGVLVNEEILERQIGGAGYRVIISGIGGDELLGGVPTPHPELADYLAERDIAKLLRRTLAWSLANRSSILQTLHETVKYKKSLFSPHKDDQTIIPPWISKQLRRICTDLLERERSEFNHRGRSPSSVCMGQAWYSILESQPHLNPGFTVRREHRYPYLDLDLVDFLLKVPRTQIVQPGRRRAMMRRALRGIVPTQILERPQKAFLARNPLELLQRERNTVEAVLRTCSDEGCHYFDTAALRSAFHGVLEGAVRRWMPTIKNAIDFELWLRLKNSAVSADSAGPNERIAGREVELQKLCMDR